MKSISVSCHILILNVWNAREEEVSCHFPIDLKIIIGKKKKLQQPS